MMEQKLHIHKIVPHYKGHRFNCTCGKVLYISQFIDLNSLVSREIPCNDCGQRWLIRQKAGDLRYYALEMG
jgi:hypothetical protein